MSKFDYDQSRAIDSMDYSFYAIIMAAMRKADSENLEMLRAMWPATWDELQKRYNAPGGYLEGEMR